ncbi:MAG TPA: PIG-L family deacetylase [Patescibacteria group bacterium]|nr:PIG-L family deacetylase [Patescibacteria group bacterium]
MRTTDDIRRLGTILFVAAHPDDESFMAGGVMAAAVANGQLVLCVTATRGEAGSTQDEARWPKAKLGAIREEELMTGLKELGVTHHYFFGYTDGHCADSPADQAVSGLCGIIERYLPDTILTFGPDGMTGHPDHKKACDWVGTAIKRVSKPPHVYYAIQTQENYQKALKAVDDVMNIFFMIDEPPFAEPSQCSICFRLPPGILQQKCLALAAMPSQTDALFTKVPRDTVEQALEWEFFVDASFNRK